MRTRDRPPPLACSSCPGSVWPAGLPVFDAGLNTLGIQEQWIQLKALYESVRPDRQPDQAD